MPTSADLRGHATRVEFHLYFSVFCACYRYVGRLTIDYETFAIIASDCLFKNFLDKLCLFVKLKVRRQNPRDIGIMFQHRRGVTLVELMVVFAIIGVLLALMLPSVQRSRESARRISCQNNLRQTALALQAFHSFNKQIPSLYNGSFTNNGSTISYPRRYWDELHFHSWQTAILPQLEQSALYDQLDFTKAASDPSNQANVNVELSMFVCPSTSNYTSTVPHVRKYAPNDVIGTAARSDYEAIGGVLLSTESKDSMLLYSHIDFGIWGLPRYSKVVDVSQDGSYDGLNQTSFREVTDGLSNTIAVGEIAGRPDIYVRGKPDIPYGDPNGGHVMRSTWAISGSHIGIVLSKNKGVNETNVVGLYSFHEVGANVAFADGSVRLLSNSTDQKVIHELATRAGDE